MRFVVAVAGWPNIKNVRNIEMASFVVDALDKEGAEALGMKRWQDRFPDGSKGMAIAMGTVTNARTS